MLRRNILNTAALERSRWTQRNEVFERAVEIGLDPWAFDWIEEKGFAGIVIHRIQHGPTGAFLRINYVISMNHSGHSLDCWPQTVELETLYIKDWRLFTSKIGLGFANPCFSG
jgi:hypothetical protein